jgi:hypothetical protein
VKVNVDTQHVALTLIEAKKESLPLGTAATKRRAMPNANG